MFILTDARLLNAVFAPLLDGVCHVAVVLLVAVKTCPVVGAVAALTSTVVVALFKELVDEYHSPLFQPH